MRRLCFACALALCLWLPWGASAQERSAGDLVRELQDPSPLVRAEAAAGLGFRRDAPAEAVEALGRALTDSEEQVRYEAAVSLERLGPLAAPALPMIVEACGNGSARVRLPLMGSLGALGTTEPGAVTLLRSVLRTDLDESVRSSAARALVRVGPAACALAAPELAAALATRTPSADDALKQAGAAAVPSLLERLEADDCGNRIGLAWTLWSIPLDGFDVRPALRRMLASDHPAKRLAGADLWWRLGLEDGARLILPVLIGELERESEADYFSPCVVLEAMGPAALPAVPALIAVLERPRCDSYERKGAVEALGSIGKGAVTAIPALERLAEREPEMKEAIAVALRSIRGRGASGSSGD